MVAIAIDEWLFCHGDEVAEAVAGRLELERLEDETLLASAAAVSGLDRETIRQIVYAPRRGAYRRERTRLRAVAALRHALASALDDDGWLYLGLAGHLLPDALSHVLTVSVSGTRDYRLARAAEVGLTRRAATRRLDRDDEARARWVQRLRGRKAWDPTLYDVFLAMHTSSVEEAVDLVCASASKPALAATAAARAAVEDFKLAARVNLVLAEHGHDVDVACSGGAATILIGKPAVFARRLERRLERLAAQVSGVHGVTTKPGPRYREADMVVRVEFEVPGRVLLVDDEKEFVHTLSERLEARAIRPAIAYDGEQALEMVATDQPEVMVLDLKMPGIDGIEVLRRLKRTHPDTAVIILTGHGSEAEESLAAKLGAFAYLRKPVDIELLTETMRAAYRHVAAHSADPDD